MAGKDIEMNTFSPATDCEYIYIELANGSQGKIKKSDLAKIVYGLIGGIFPKLFPSPSRGSTKGFIVKTSINANRQYCAIRLQCSIGFCQTGMSNENFSINIKYWDYVFASSALSRENYAVSLCNYVICYIDDDTFSFYLNILYPNLSNGYVALYAISNIHGNDNQVLSLGEVNTEYIIGSHSQESKITIS